MRVTRFLRPPTLPARTRERLRNWLGLLALLAGSIVFAPVHAAAPPAEHAGELLLKPRDRVRREAAAAVDRGRVARGAEQGHQRDDDRGQAAQEHGAPSKTGADGGVERDSAKAGRESGPYMRFLDTAPLARARIVRWSQQAAPPRVGGEQPSVGR